MNFFSFIKRTLLLGKKSYQLFPKNKSVSVSKDLVTGKYININIPDPDIELKIGVNVHFREFCNILILKNAGLFIGNNVFFNNYCSINCLGKIYIGNNTLFGEEVKIYDHNHQYERGVTLKVHTDKFTIDAVSIGDNCWIGSNVTILKGVTIGDNVIIGANNLIYKSVPPNSVVKANTPPIIETF